jgi:hypothetical protein
VVDAAKAVPAAAFIGLWHLNISLGEFTAFTAVVGSLYTLTVAAEKFYKIAQWAVKKFKKPPEG